MFCLNWFFWALVFHGGWKWSSRSRKSLSKGLNKLLTHGSLHHSFQFIKIYRRRAILFASGGIGEQLFCTLLGQHSLCRGLVVVLVCDPFGIPNTAISVQYRSLFIPHRSHCCGICFEFDTLPLWLELEYVHNDGALLLWVLFGVMEPSQWYLMINLKWAMFTWAYLAGPLELKQNTTGIEI